MLNELYPPTPIYQFAFFWYFALINTVYIILLILGTLSVYFRYREVKIEDFTQILKSNFMPEITFLVSMYNEEKNILKCIDSIRNLSYPFKQIIAVNDGSEDNTMQLLKDKLELIPIPSYYQESILTQPIIGLYRSKIYPEVIVIDKLHAGKYDAVNAGINANTNPFFIAVDVDTFVDDSGFEALLRPILTYPDTVAVGASVRIKNGCTLDYNRVSTRTIPFRWLPIFQGLEYLRSFLQRLGWNNLGGNFIIAGAFSIFNAELVKKMGGLSPSVAEDIEIIVRIHRLMKDTNTPYRIFYLPDPIAWTEGPSTLKSLGKQRTRWHLGLLETLWYHKRMCFNPRYGFFGLFNLPYWVICEALEPIVEILAFGLLIVGWAFGILNVPFAILLLLTIFGFIFIYSVTCIVIEEFSFRKYPSLKTVSMLLLMGVAECFGYRQLTVYWRFKSFIQFFKNFKKVREDSRKIKNMIKIARK